jgi:hypothetical protein
METVMKIKSMIAAAAAAAMLTAPVAANAGTTAAASLNGVKPVLSSKEVRASRSVKRENGISAAGYVIGALALGFATYGIVKAIDKSNG